MTVKDLNGIFAILPPDFEVRVVGLYNKPYSLDHYEILDVCVSYLHKQVTIFPKYENLSINQSNNSVSDL